MEIYNGKSVRINNNHRYIPPTTMIEDLNHMRRNAELSGVYYKDKISEDEFELYMKRKKARCYYKYRKYKTEHNNYLKLLNDPSYLKKKHKESYMNFHNCSEEVYLNNHS